MLQVAFDFNKILETGGLGGLQLDDEATLVLDTEAGTVDVVTELLFKRKSLACFETEQLVDEAVLVIDIEADIVEAAAELFFRRECRNLSILSASLAFLASRNCLTCSLQDNKIQNNV